MTSDDDIYLITAGPQARTSKTLTSCAWTVEYGLSRYPRSLTGGNRSSSVHTAHICWHTDVQNVLQTADNPPDLTPRTDTTRGVREQWLPRDQRQTCGRSRRFCSTIGTSRLTAAGVGSTHDRAFAPADPIYSDTGAMNKYTHLSVSERERYIY